MHAPPVARLSMAEREVLIDLCDKVIAREPLSRREQRRVVAIFKLAYLRERANVEPPSQASDWYCCGHATQREICELNAMDRDSPRRELAERAVNAKARARYEAGRAPRSPRATDAPSAWPDWYKPGVKAELRAEIARQRAAGYARNPAEAEAAARSVAARPPAPQPPRSVSGAMEGPGFVRAIKIIR